MIIWVLFSREKQEHTSICSPFNIGLCFLTGGSRLMNVQCVMSR